MFGHGVFDGFAAEPDLTTVTSWPGDFLDRKSVTDLTVENGRLRGRNDKGFHFSTKDNTGVTISLSGAGASPDGSVVTVNLGPGEQFKRSGVDDINKHVKADGTVVEYPGSNNAYYIDFSNPLTVDPTGTDGSTDSESTTDETSTTETKQVVPTSTTPTTPPAETGKSMKVLAIGGIVVIGGIAAMGVMKKRRA